MLGLLLALAFVFIARRERRGWALAWAPVWLTLPPAVLGLALLAAGRPHPSPVIWVALAALPATALCLTATALPARRRVTWLACALAAGAVAGALLPPSTVGWLPALALGLPLTAASFRLWGTLELQGMGRRAAAAGLAALALESLVIAALCASGLIPPAAPLVTAIVLSALMLQLVSALGLVWAHLEQAYAALERARRQLEEIRGQLVSEAATDPLTEFHNRRAFRDFVERVRSGEAPPSGIVMVLDINGLKRINDSLGHSAGDRAILRTAWAIRAAAPPSALLIRWGGDEFVVALPGASLGDAEDMVAAIRGGLESERLSASAGISAYGLEREVVVALREADRRMYLAKKQRTAARRAEARQLPLPLEGRLDPAAPRAR